MESGSLRSAWDEIYNEGRWDYLSTDPVEFNRLQIAIGWMERSGAKSVLDVGCGKGQLLGLLNPARFTSYIGLDVSEVALEKFQGRDDIAFSTLHLDIQKQTPPIEVVVDCICFIDVLYYCTDPAAVIRQYANHLGDGGVVITCHYVRPDRILEGTSLADVMTARADEQIQEGAIDTLLDSLTLVSITTPRRWHMKLFRPRRNQPQHQA